MKSRKIALIAALGAIALSSDRVQADDLVRPARDRFAADEIVEIPDFQRHVLPLMGRLGCNSRSCHGSFQGAGGFRLSLFGYDFDADRDELMKDKTKRVVLDDPDASLILSKPTLLRPHKGGKRMEADGWAYQLLSKWIEAGAKGLDREAAPHFERLEVTPAEIVFTGSDETIPLKVLAHWSDGTVEDVTCLSRYRTNDESIAEIDEDGVVRNLNVGDTHVVAFYDNGVVPVPVMRAVSDKAGDRYPKVATPTLVDERIVAKLRKLGVIPSELCDDAEFFRRVSIDLTGTLPSPAEVDAFLADPRPDKRSAKIDELLESPAYAAWWTTVLCDVTGNAPKHFQGMTEPQVLAKQWYDWIERLVRENVHYDQIIEGIALGVSRKPGESYDDYARDQSAYFRKDDPVDFTERESMPYFWAKRNIRKPEEKALAFSYAFLGVKLECAQCHKHPFDQWTQDDFKHFQAFFDQVGFGTAPDARQRYNAMRKDLDLPQNNAQAQREISKLLADGKTIPWQEVFVTPRRPARNAGVKDKDAKAAQRKNARVITPKVLGGEEVEFTGNEDPRQPLMDWLRSKENPYFARAFVNRVWANDFGRGIIEPPDDMNLANPPSNAELLDDLADGFVDHDYDMKWLHRQILNSHAYQRSWRTNATNEHDDRNFSHAAIRRLPAEVMVDAVNLATSGEAKADKLRHDMAGRSIGPYNFANGAKRGGTLYAGRVFGASTRESNCDCNRSNEPNLLQSVFLQNDNELNDALLRGGWLAESVKALKAKGRDVSADEVDRIIRDAYQRTVSRPPSQEDLDIARGFLQDVDPSKGLRDLMWALVNTKEFQTNH